MAKPRARQGAKRLKSLIENPFAIRLQLLVAAAVLRQNGLNQVTFRLGIDCYKAFFRNFRAGNSYRACLPPMTGSC